MPRYSVLPVINQDQVCSRISLPQVIDAIVQAVDQTIFHKKQFAAMPVVAFKQPARFGLGIARRQPQQVTVEQLVEIIECSI